MSPFTQLSGSVAEAARSMSVAVRVARTVDEVEALRDAWWALDGDSLPADIDYFLTVARHHPEMDRPHVVVVERDGAPVSIAAAYVQRGWIAHRIGPWAPYRPVVRALTLAYNGIVGDTSDEVIEAITKSLYGSVAAGEADAVHLRFTDPEGPLTDSLTRVVPALRRQHLVPLRPHWGVSIPECPNALLSGMSASTRQSLRRTSRRFERTWGDSMRVEIHHTPDTLDQLSAQVDAIAERSYQYEGAPVLASSPLDRALIELGLERGWFRAYVLSVEDRPIAYWTGFAYGGTFGWRGATGYDPAFRSHSPGTYLLMRLLEDLCRDDGVSLFDLGGGDVEYKQRIANVYWQEVDVRAFGPGVRNASRALAGTSVNALHAAARRCASLIGARRAPTLARRRRLKADALSRAGAR